MTLPFDFIAYGILMIVLNVTAGKISPDLSGLWLVTGIGSGGLGFFWGVWGLRGWRYPKWTSLTLAAISGLLVWLNAIAWHGLQADQSKTRLTIMLTSLMLIFSIAQLILFRREEKKPPT